MLGTVEYRVELAEIVEAYLGIGRRLKGRTLVIVAQVTQGAITNPMLRDVSERFFDVDQGLSRGCIRLHVDAERVNAGKPAQRGTEVNVVKQVFASMSFQINQHVTLRELLPDQQCPSHRAQ